MDNFDLEIVHKTKKKKPTLLKKTRNENNKSMKLDKTDRIQREQIRSSSPVLKQTRPVSPTIKSVSPKEFIPTKSKSPVRSKSPTTKPQSPVRPKSPTTKSQSPVRSKSPTIKSVSPKEFIPTKQSSPKQTRTRKYSLPKKRQQPSPRQEPQQPRQQPSPRQLQQSPGQPQSQLHRQIPIKYTSPETSKFNRYLKNKQKNDILNIIPQTKPQRSSPVNRNNRRLSPVNRVNRNNTNNIKKIIYKPNQEESSQQSPRQQSSQQSPRQPSQQSPRQQHPQLNRRNNILDNRLTELESERIRLKQLRENERNKLQMRKKKLLQRKKEKEIINGIENERNLLNKMMDEERKMDQYEELDKQLKIQEALKKDYIKQNNKSKTVKKKKYVDINPKDVKTIKKVKFALDDNKVIDIANKIDNIDNYKPIFKKMPEELPKINKRKVMFKEEFRVDDKKDKVDDRKDKVDDKKQDIKKSGSNDDSDDSRKSKVSDKESEKRNDKKDDVTKKGGSNKLNNNFKLFIETEKKNGRKCSEKYDKEYWKKRPKKYWECPYNSKHYNNIEIDSGLNVNYDKIVNDKKDFNIDEMKNILKEIGYIRTRNHFSDKIIKLLFNIINYDEKIKVYK